MLRDFCKLLLIFQIRHISQFTFRIPRKTVQWLIQLKIIKFVCSKSRIADLNFIYDNTICQDYSLINVRLTNEKGENSPRCLEVLIMLVRFSCVINPLYFGRSCRFEMGFSLIRERTRREILRTTGHDARWTR